MSEEFEKNDHSDITSGENSSAGQESPENNQEQSSGVYRFNQSELNKHNENQETHSGSQSGYTNTENQQQSSYSQTNYGGQQQSYYQSGYGQQGTYQNNYQQSGPGYGGYQSQGGQYGPYQNGYQQNYNPYQRPQKRRKKGEAMKKAKPWIKMVCYGLVFGLVAGGALTGVNALTRTLGGNQNEINVVKTSSEGVETMEAQDVSDVAEEVLPSIVAVNTQVTIEQQDFFGRTYSQEGEGAGSGIIFSQDDDNIYILTNNHVITDSTAIQVTFNDETTAEAQIIGYTESPDIAVLSVPLSSLDDSTKDAIKVAVIGDSDQLKIGEGAIAIGNALGYGQSVVTGTVSALNRTVQLTDGTETMLQTSAAINPGNSGGALLNTKGEVIGVNTAKYSDTSVEGVGWAIPINQAIETAQGILSGDIVTKTDENTAALGIRGGTLNQEYAEQYGFPQGVLVTTVYDNSAASRAGIQAGTIITEFNGVRTETMETLQEELAKCSPGDSVTMKICEPNSSGGYGDEQEVTTLLGSMADMPEEE